VRHGSCWHPKARPLGGREGERVKVRHGSCWHPKARPLGGREGGWAGITHLALAGALLGERVAVGPYRLAQLEDLGACTLTREENHKHTLVHLTHTHTHTHTSHTHTHTQTQTAMIRCSDLLRIRRLGFGHGGTESGPGTRHDMHTSLFAANVNGLPSCLTYWAGATKRRRELHLPPARDSLHATRSNHDVMGAVGGSFTSHPHAILSTRLAPTTM
jgi:hypothetical protein